MRRTRNWITCLLLGLCLFEVYLVVAAQDRVTPWPPPPVRHSPEDADGPPPRRQPQAVAPAPAAESSATAPPLVAQAPLPPIRDVAPAPVAPPAAESSATAPAAPPLVAQAPLPPIRDVAPAPVAPEAVLPPIRDVPPMPITPVAGTADATAIQRALGQQPVAPPVPAAPPLPEGKVNELPPPSFPAVPTSAPAAPLGKMGEGMPPALPAPVVPEMKQADPAPAPLVAGGLPGGPAPAPPTAPAPLALPPVTEVGPPPAPAPSAPTPPVPVREPAPAVLPNSIPERSGPAPAIAPAPDRPATPGPRVMQRVRPSSAPMNPGTAPVAPTTLPLPAAPTAPVLPATNEIHRVNVPPREPAAPVAAMEGLPVLLPRLAPAAAEQLAVVNAAPPAWFFQTPRLSVEKRGPAMLQAGETAFYLITVRNPSDEQVSGLQIEDALPREARALGADPAAAVKDGHVRWAPLGLGPREQITFGLSVQALAAVQFGNTTSIVGGQVVAHAAAAENRAPSPPQPAAASSVLAVQLQGPGSVPLGQKALFKIAFTNQGRQPLRELLLYAFLPEGLEHPAGPRVVTDIVELQPGENKTVELTTIAKKQGRCTVQVKVVATAGGEATAQCVLDVGGAGLVVQQTAGTTQQVGREGEVDFVVANQSGQALRHVEIVYALPEGVDFVTASNRGGYQENTRTVYWLLDQLQPGQAQTLAIKVQPRQGGQFSGEVLARAEGLTVVKAPAALAVEGFADLAISVIDQENPLPLGKDTIYEIRVTNPGSAPARNVKLQIEFPGGMARLQAEGPVQTTGKARSTFGARDVTFEPILLLPAQGTLTYRVKARADQAGEQRLRVLVGCDGLRTPVVREHATQVQAAAPAAPPSAAAAVPGN